MTRDPIVFTAIVIGAAVGAAIMATVFVVMR